MKADAQHSAAGNPAREKPVPEPTETTAASDVIVPASACSTNPATDLHSDCGSRLAGVSS